MEMTNSSLHPALEDDEQFGAERLGSVQLRFLPMPQNVFTPPASLGDLTRQLAHGYILATVPAASANNYDWFLCTTSAVSERNPGPHDIALLVCHVALPFAFESLRT